MLQVYFWAGWGFLWENHIRRRKEGSTKKPQASLQTFPETGLSGPLGISLCLLGITRWAQPLNGLRCQRMSLPSCFSLPAGCLSLGVFAIFPAESCWPWWGSRPNRGMLLILFSFPHGITEPHLGKGNKGVIRCWGRRGQPLRQSFLGDTWAIQVCNFLYDCSSFSNKSPNDSVGDGWRQGSWMLK